MRLHKTRTLKFIITSIGFSLSITFCPAYGQPSNLPQGHLIDKIIAKVDNFIILQSELEGVYQNYLFEGNPRSNQVKCELLTQMITNKLIVAKAEIDSVVVSDEEVDANTVRRINLILQSLGNSPEELEKTYGKSLDQIRLDLRDQVREQLLIREMTQKITTEINITPVEVKRFFKKIPRDSIPYYSSDVMIAQIVRFAKISGSQTEAVKRQLREIRQRILTGQETWGEAARKYSDDPSARTNEGSMGYVGRGMMTPPYEAMAFSLQQGEISEPFESSFGWHIMQLIDRRGNEYNSRHILLSVIPSEEDKQQASLFLDSLRLQILKDSISFEEAARQYSDDLITKGQGGSLLNDSGGDRISLREIDPVVYLALDTLSVDHISEPLVYRSDRGEQGSRIIFLKEKVPPHQANLTDDWSRLQAAALAEKKDRALKEWFSKSRSDVYISISPDYAFCQILKE